MIKLTDLIEGETVIESYAGKRLVLGVHKYYCVLSNYDNFTQASENYTEEELNENNFKIVKPEPKWHDITPEEFIGCWNKKVWAWNASSDRACLINLAGFDPDGCWRYLSSNCGVFKHASINKPE